MAFSQQQLNGVLPIRAPEGGPHWLAAKDWIAARKVEALVEVRILCLSEELDEIIWEGGDRLDRYGVVSGHLRRTLEEVRTSPEDVDNLMANLDGVGMRPL